MIVLGIYGGHESGVCLVEDGKIISAIQEERINRIKHFIGFPRKSIFKCLEIAGIKSSDVDVVAFNAMEMLPTLYSLRKKNFPKNLITNSDNRNISTIWDYYLFLAENTGLLKYDIRFSKKITERMIRKSGFENQKLFIVDHHKAHAITAKHMNPEGKHLVITLDGRGNGLSGGVWIGKNGRITENISQFKTSGSLGYFYGNITEVLGYRMDWDECKTMALAPFGNPESVYSIFKKMFHVNNLKICKRFPKKYTRRGGIFLERILNQYEKKDIAAAAQKILEDTVCRLVKNSTEETGIRDVMLSGGVFLNVKLNKRIMEMDCVKDVKIFPAAGDDGIAAGSALLAYNELTGNNVKSFGSPYLGDEFSEEEIQTSLEKYKNKFEVEHREDVSDFVGEELLPRGMIGGWFQGRMEMGPRALGNRSVLADPRDRGMPKKLISCLKDRPAFQPFCQSILDRVSKDYIVNPKNVDASYMIMAFDSTERGREETPAVVHIDNSIRPQLLTRQMNPKYYQLIEKFGEVTGIPVVLNTSFNVSSEPIVHTPLDALNDFIRTKLDFLAIGNFILTRR
jgi:carbamoyltransferase